MTDLDQERNELFTKLIELMDHDSSAENLLRTVILGTMASRFIHESNNYLTGIIGYTNLALQTTGDAGKTREFINKTKDCCDLGQQLNQMFLRLFPKRRYDSSRTGISLIINDVVNFCAKMFGPNCKIEHTFANSQDLLSIKEQTIRDILLYLLIYDAKED